MFGFGKLLYISLLIVNSIAVLSEDRFLLRVGWSAQPDATGFGGDNSQSVKTKLINLVTAVRTLLRIPLIAVNTLVIAYLLLLG